MAEIKLQNVSKRWGSFVGVDGIDLTISDREFLVLLGPSGCGKTTTMRMIAGLIDPTEGTERWRWRPGYHVSGITVPPGVQGRQAVAVTNQGNIVSFVVPRKAPPWGQDDGMFSRLGDRPGDMTR